MSLLTTTQRVHLLDVDPELGERLDARRAALARHHLVAGLRRVDAGGWSPTADAFGAEGGFGLLIVCGLAVRRVSLGHRSAAELLGSGDLMRPWQDDGEHAAYPFSASFRVVEPLELAVLDRALMLRMLHFPELVDSLFSRVMIRARRVVGHLVIAQLTSVDTRLHVLLWHVAERFGRVRPDGVVVPVSLTHETLGLIVGARRPSVTAAMGRLVTLGLVEPLVRGGWLLKGDPPEEIGRLTASTDGATSLD